MTEAKAIEHLREMMWAVQRARSIITEQFGDFPNLMEELNPWLFGKQCVLPTLVDTLDKVEAGASLQPITFYNLMTIAQKTPAIDAALFSTRQESLPEPNAAWLVGWDEVTNPEKLSSHAQKKGLAK